MRVRIVLSFPEPDFALLRWLLGEVVGLHARAPANVQITTEVDRG